MTGTLKSTTIIHRVTSFVCVNEAKLLFMNMNDSLYYTYKEFEDALIMLATRQWQVPLMIKSTTNMSFMSDLSDWSEMLPNCIFYTLTHAENTLIMLPGDDRTGLWSTTVFSRHRSLVGHLTGAQMCTYHYTMIIVVCLSVTYEREMTGSDLIQAKTFSFSASLDLGRYNRQPNDKTSYGPNCD